MSTIQYSGIDAAAPQRQEPEKRLYVKSTLRQRQILAKEFAEHGHAKQIGYYEAKTRLSKKTVQRLVAKLENGEDITVIGKRGRKPKYTPELLKALASDLCTKNMTLRQVCKEVAEANRQAVSTGGDVLPQVSKSTIHRYITNDELMRDVDIGPLSFTQVTERGPAANSDENKQLRIERRQELDALIRAGYLVVFVDESHWSVGNVRTRAWGPKGEKHFRTTNLASFSLSCICSISQIGQKHCKIFNTTINADIFKAYMKSLVDLYRIDGENVVFVMDNATIHRREIVELAESNGCKVLFNAPYSPECNPIELVFGIWKTRVGKLTNVDIADLLVNIARCFETISATEIRECINHFLYDVTVKVMNREDL